MTEGERPTVILRTLDGTALCVARIDALRLDLPIALDVFAGRADILFHYLRGVREVVLECGDFRFGGILSSETVDEARCWFFAFNPRVVPPRRQQRRPPLHEE